MAKFFITEILSKFGEERETTTHPFKTKKAMVEKFKEFQEYCESEKERLEYELEEREPDSYDSKWHVSYTNSKGKMVECNPNL